MAFSSLVPKPNFNSALSLPPITTTTSNWGITCIMSKQKFKTKRIPVDLGQLQNLLVEVMVLECKL